MLGDKEKTEAEYPAFPCETRTNDGGYSMFSGMTLLDYFAAQALQGILSSDVIVKEMTGDELRNEPICEHAAATAYNMAERMIIEKLKREETK